MKVQAIKTERIEAGTTSVLALLDQYIISFPEGGILAITSKVISLCENRVVPAGSVSKEQLIIQESDKYAPEVGPHGFHFTVTNNTLIPSAGIDESNGNGDYILWPTDAQATANKIREYLRRRFNVKKVGVIIADSTCTPMRRGTLGICLAHSGFKAQNDYIGKPDLFGRLYKVGQSNISGGLAAAATVCMGEGAESTPLCLIEDVDFVQFQKDDPIRTEIERTYIPVDEDIFAPFLSLINWASGDGLWQKYIDPAFKYSFTQSPSKVPSMKVALRDGLNCITLAHLVIKDLFGYSLPASCQCAEMFNDTARFSAIESVEDMRAGDLVWFGEDSPKIQLKDYSPCYGRDGSLLNWRDNPVKHVAIYIGRRTDDYLMLHATNVEGTNAIWPLHKFAKYKQYQKIYKISRFTPNIT